MITVEHDRHRDRIVIRASGTLTADDYAHAIPEIEHAMDLSSGPLKVKLRLEDFRGWEIDALWQELDFDLNRRPELARIAVIGETRLEEWGTKLSAPFAGAEMRFFPTERETEADSWLAGSGDGPGGAA